MAVTEATLRHLRQLSISISARVDETNRALIRAWSSAWSEISDEFSVAIGDLIELGEGEWPTRSQVLRAQRVINAMKIATDALDDLGREAGVTITRGAPALVNEVDRLYALIGQSQLPPGQTAVSWSRVSATALNRIVRRTTEQVTSLTVPLSQRSADAMRSVLIRGVALGDNPRTAAREMMRRTEGAFTGGRHRATNIATTEMLDASRHASHEARQANAELLAGWEWQAKLDDRTCGSCVAQHGQRFPIEQFGPEDHQRGRCTSLPITKTWRELGFDLDESVEERRQSGEDWYGQQSEATQIAIMGRERAARLADGRLNWDQVSYHHDNPGWRPSWSLRPLDG